MISYMDLIELELGGLYGAEIIRDLNEIIELYRLYDGPGQEWNTPGGLDYEPTKKKRNLIKKLIKEEARFLFGKTPEYEIVTEDKEAAVQALKCLNGALRRNNFPEKIIKAARDCFIGKRVAMKISCTETKQIRISFYPSLSFIHEVMDDDIDELQSIVFFYSLNQKVDKSLQRIWKQKYWLESGKCFLDEAIYDGYGKLIEVRYQKHDTGLEFIPAKVVLNDGLSGELKGESDVDELRDLQEMYNRLTSDDIDALQFNMFPQTVAVNASEESLSKIKIAPGSLIDMQPESTSLDMKPEMYKLESSFQYDTRMENTLNRIKNEMHELLSIPNISPDQLKGYITSGKSMKALYWQLVTRCEEKYTAWRPALEWLGESILKMTTIYGLEPIRLPNDMVVQVENVYPLMEDELEEKASDMQAVNTQTMSRKTYIKKWNSDVDDATAEEELKQMQREREMLEDSYSGGLGDE